MRRRTIAVRQRLGLADIRAQFKDRFLIADVKMKADFPDRARFWFDRRSTTTRTCCLHRQPDELWRIDFQLGRDADPEEETKPGARDASAGAARRGRPVELEWASVYSFASFACAASGLGRLLFAGDPAQAFRHLAPAVPTSGVQDADNLAWKLRPTWSTAKRARAARHVCAEREYAADENILFDAVNDFISPTSAISRDVPRCGSRPRPGARVCRTHVNSGRLVDGGGAARVSAEHARRSADAFAGALWFRERVRRTRRCETGKGPF